MTTAIGAAIGISVRISVGTTLISACSSIALAIRAFGRIIVSLTVAEFLLAIGDIERIPAISAADGSEHPFAIAVSAVAIA